MLFVSINFSLEKDFAEIFPAFVNFNKYNNNNNNNNNNIYTGGVLTLSGFRNGPVKNIIKKKKKKKEKT